MRVNKGLRIQAPRGKMALSYAQVREAAAQNKAKALALLANGPMSAIELNAQMGLGLQRVRTLMHQLSELGKVKSVLLKFAGRKKGEGPTRAMYSLVDEVESDDDAPHQVIAQQYPAHHHRDSLVAALFGAAPHIKQ